jgi:hypothetical protein
VVFSIQTSGGTGTIRAIVTNRSNFMQLVALAGQPIAPSSSDPTRLWGSLNGVGLFIADNGRLVVGATASPSFPLGSSGRWGVMTSDSADQWTLTGGTGLPFPGDPSVTYTGPILVSAAQVDTGLVGFAVRVGEQYYFLREGNAGLAVVDALPPTPLFQSPNTPSLTSSGSYAYTGQQSGQPYGFVRGQFAGGSAMVSLLSAPTTFLNAAGTWRLGPTDGILSGNDVGDLLFSTWLIDPVNDAAPPIYALVHSTAAGLVLLAKVGDPVPGHPGLVWRNLSVSNGVLSDSGEAVWESTVDGAGVTSSNQAVLVKFSAGPSPTMTMIARQGEPVADLPGYTYSQTFACGMTRSGRVLFTNSVIAQDHSVHTTIFVAEPAGVNRAVIVDGGVSVINIPGLGGVSVTGTSGVQPTGGNDGMKRTLTEDGRIAVRILYPSGSAIAMLSVPCAADIGAPGGAAGYDGSLDNNDFIAFISLFFAADRRADRGVAGGLPGADGQFDNNDFIVFINQFFAGC